MQARPSLLSNSWIFLSYGLERWNRRCLQSAPGEECCHERASMLIEALRWLPGQALAAPGSHRALGHRGDRGDLSSGHSVGQQLVSSAVTCAWNP